MKTKGQRKAVSTIVIGIVILCLIITGVFLLIGDFGNLYSTGPLNVTLVDAQFYHSSGNFTFQLDNPSKQVVKISSVKINNLPCVASFPPLIAGEISSASCIASSRNFTEGRNENYSISFSKGQSSIYGTVSAV